MDEHFWERCIAAECVIVPVRAYSDYDQDGNIDESLLIGIRYLALDHNDPIVIGPDYWFMLDEQSTGAGCLFDTPLAALEAFERAAHGNGDSP